VRKLAVTVLVALSMLVPPVAVLAAAEITPADIAAAEAKRRAIAAELTGATAEYDAAVVRAELLAGDVSQLAGEIAVRERDLSVLRSQARDVARELYMTAGSGGMVTLFDAASITDLGVRQGYLDLANRDNEFVLSRLEAVEQAYLDQQALLEEALVEQEAVTTELEVLAEGIMGELVAADAEYQELVAAYQAQEAEKRRIEEERRRQAEEAARRATSTTTPGNPPTSSPATPEPEDTSTPPPPPPAPPVTDGKTCPINGPTSFSDSWGAPRSGGRTHQGVDMISPRGTPVVAIESGTVARLSNGGLGGITVWLRGASGDEYYYAHLDGWAPGLSAGQGVSVGELLGYVGNTGNARYTVSHLHFEHHPGGGGAINPYPLVRSLC
jgi:murein DD-endopeptidase MepM/ murein hydrolase activator NlpD